MHPRDRFTTFYEKMCLVFKRYWCLRLTLKKKKTTTTTPLAFGFSKILKFYYAGTAMVFTREPANVCDNPDVSQLYWLLHNLSCCIPIGLRESSGTFSSFSWKANLHIPFFLNRFCLQILIPASQLRCVSLYDFLARSLFECTDKVTECKSSEITLTLRPSSLIQYSGLKCAP